MAADTGLFIGEIIVSHSCRKLLRTHDGWLVGTAGSASMSEEFEKWVVTSRKKPFTSEIGEDFTALVVKSDGTILQYDDVQAPFAVNSDYHAIGVGRDIAYGALAVGASAIAAVQAAIDHHVWCAGKPHTIAL